jgi:hypothetical protein
MNFIAAPGLFMTINKRQRSEQLSQYLGFKAMPYNLFFGTYELEVLTNGRDKTFANMVS